MSQFQMQARIANNVIGQKGVFLCHKCTLKVPFGTMDLYQSYNLKTTKNGHFSPNHFFFKFMSKQPEGLLRAQNWFNVSWIHNILRKCNKKGSSFSKPIFRNWDMPNHSALSICVNRLIHIFYVIKLCVWYCHKNCLSASPCPT